MRHYTSSQVCTPERAIPDSTKSTAGARRPAPRQASRMADARTKLRHGQGVCGVASRQPPRGLPRAAPGASLAHAADSEKTMLPPGQRVVGLRQADGMPHNTQRARPPPGPSLGRGASGSVEKPGEVARAFLLMKSTDPPVSAGGNVRGGRAGL
jgi:hypothetical protein